MSFVKNHKGKIISAICIVFILFIAFFCGENHDINREADKVQTATDKITYTDVSQNTSEGNIHNSKEEEIDTKADPTPYYAEPDSKDEPAEKEPEKKEDSNSQFTCTLSVRCDLAVGKVPEKADIIPKDGVIFAEQTVVFYEGESVFNVLVREMKKNKIHLEFVNTPGYNSVYIEGIGNLYEFDCGELSGWMYRVNGIYPNFGSSQYKLKNKDKVEWVYTCDLGKDIGGEYSAKNGME